MNRPYSNNGATPRKSFQQRAPERLTLADQMPFFLRAWWLRELKQAADLPWPAALALTGDIWSLYSDPLCDLGNVDYADDL